MLSFSDLAALACSEKKSWENPSPIETFKQLHYRPIPLYIQCKAMLENLIITPDIRDKLLRDDHNVKEEEVRECFLNHDGFYIEDTEEEHASDPPTEWFVG